MKLLELKFSWLTTPNLLIGYLGIRRQNAGYRQSQPICYGFNQIKSDPIQRSVGRSYLNADFNIIGAA